MATYVLPQVLVFQDFSIVPAAAANPLRAHISGPHAQLIRYAQTDERPAGRLGYYDRLLDTDYAWPGRPAGGLVDPTYAKLWVQDAILLYFQDTVGAGSVITKTAGVNNRIRSATRNFAANGTYARYAGLLDRDVRVGDVAEVRGVTGLGASITLWTYVKALHGDVAVSAIEAIDNDANNSGSQGLSSSIVQTAGPENCVTAAVNAAAYDGLVSGDINETYELIVTQASEGGDFTTALLRVISGSGEDDVASVVPAAHGSPTTIGTRGLTVTFSTAASAGCSASATLDQVSPDDLHVGQRYMVTVHQAFTPPVATSGGTYDSAADTTYIITVTRGGSLDGSILPQFLVSTTNGTDISGPTLVTAASTPFDVGTLGVTVSFSATHLRAGDRYYIDATGTTVGPMRTIELGHNLSTDIPADSEVDLTLYIHNPLLEVPKNRIGFAPELNWDTSATTLTVKSGIVAYDTTWTSSGVQQPMDVYSEPSKRYGVLYAEARYWLSDLCADVNGVSDVGDLDAAIFGPLDPDNPLKWGVFKALENSNGTEVKFTAVCNPDDDTSWADVIELLLGRDDVYELVPLTRRRTVLDLFAAHINAMAAPEQGLWRVLWTNLEGLSEVPIVSAGSLVPGHTAATTSDGLVALAVVEDDPDTAGTQYTVLRNTSVNADFLARGVRAGDTVRVLYTSDGFGNEQYAEYAVDAVQSEDQLRLLTGPTSPISVASKFEVWRTLTATEEAAALAVNAGSWGNRRIRATWPDQIESSGTTMEGYFLNCSLAGLASGVLPHQGLTRVTLTGYTSVPKTTAKFNRTQLDAMALGGVWIVTQELSPTAGTTGEIYSRHAVTTGPYIDVNLRVEMVTRNVDSISYRFKDHFKPFIGVVNVTPVIQARIEQEAGILIRILQTESATQNLGGQLVDATIISIAPSLTEKDRYVMKISAVVPYPLNVLELHIMI